MKTLTIVVDEVPIFSGEVAEINWSETGEQVSVTGRFKPAPSLLESLKAASQPLAKPPSRVDNAASDSRALDLVRDNCD